MIRIALLVVCVLPIGSTVAQGDVTIQHSPTTTIDVGGVEISITTTKARRTVVLSAKGAKKTAEIQLPKQAGQVTEFRACN